MVLWDAGLPFLLDCRRTQTKASPFVLCLWGNFWGVKKKTCFRCMPVCVCLCTMLAPGVFRGQKKTSDVLEPELQSVVNHLAHAGN